LKIPPSSKLERVNTDLQSGNHASAENQAKPGAPQKPGVRLSHKNFPNSRLDGASRALQGGSISVRFPVSRPPEKCEELFLKSACPEDASKLLA